MKPAARLREIISLLNARRLPVPRETLLEELEISLPTLKRDLAELRDTMQAPIEWVPSTGAIPGGYVLTDSSWVSGKHSLPNAWFTATELYSVLMIDELARHIGPGLLSEHLKDLIPRISMALSSAGDSAESIRTRIRILTSANHRTPSACFDTIAEATVKQDRLEIDYFTRSRNEHSVREVSPQRLIHYKENWYLTAWCHKSSALKMFALDACRDAKRLKKNAKVISQRQVDESVGQGFGIYSGSNRQWARLRFSAKQAPWVAAEEWHAEQETRCLENGDYELRVPYSNPKELVIEILKYGEDVEVLEPSSLRNLVAERLKLAAARYA